MGHPRENAEGDTEYTAVVEHLTAAWYLLALACQRPFLFCR